MPPSLPMSQDIYLYLWQITWKSQDKYVKLLNISTQSTTNFNLLLIELVIWRNIHLYLNTFKTSQIGSFYVMRILRPYGAKQNEPFWLIFWVFLLANTAQILANFMSILCQVLFSIFFLSNILYFYNCIQL